MLFVLLVCNVTAGASVTSDQLPEKTVASVVKSVCRVRALLACLCMGVCGGGGVRAFHFHC